MWDTNLLKSEVRNSLTTLTHNWSSFSVKTLSMLTNLSLLSNLDIKADPNSAYIDTVETSQKCGEELKMGGLIGKTRIF